MRHTDWHPTTLATSRVPARPAGLWTLVVEYIEGPVHLRVKATGQWEPRPGKPCGPDGHTADGVATDALLESAPVGALIAKIGGSTAEKPDATKGGILAVGTYCVISLDNNHAGPLFMTMNDRLSCFPHHVGHLDVEISEAR